MLVGQNRKGAFCGIFIPYHFPIIANMQAFWGLAPFAFALR
jgi:hypothetical protein